MNSKDIESMLASGENEHVEFKVDTTTPDLIAREVCAFLNQGGGRVLLGIGDRGKVLGVANATETVRNIESHLPQLISPWAFWTVEQVRVNDRDVVIIEAAEGMDKPYVTGGAIYFRRGAQTVPATRDEISALIQRRVQASQRWERQLALGAERSDLNEKLTRETLRMAVKSERWQGSPDDIEGFLHGLGLIAYGGITNAALLLFGKQPSRLLPQARVRLLVTPEGKTGDQYSFDRMFDDCLLIIAEQVSAALGTHAGGVSSRFSDDSWQREDRALYPSNALREGVINALVHRDYSSSGSVTISILPDSLQISNPGSLPEGLKPADLKRDHLSVPRNPDIAHVFFLHGLIEKVGRGTQRIVKDCRTARLPEPKWQSSKLETKLTFFSRPSGGIVEELSERQGQILELIRKKKQVQAAEFVKLLGGEVTGRTVRNDLQVMVDRGWLVRRGKGPSTSYAEGPTSRAK